MDLVGLLAMGFAAGMAGGLLSVALVGAWRQRGYGNLRLRDAVIIGVLSPLGVFVGVLLANTVPERALELSFAGVQLVFAWRLAGNAGLR
jgi:uncharacterized protein